jgi:hypothetical protein
MPINNSRTRTAVRWSCTVLAAAGWGCSALLGVIHGAEAGVNTWFIASLSVGICFTVVAGQWWLLPTRAERAEESVIYALGYSEAARSLGACPLRPAPVPEPQDHHKPLGLVR